MKRKLPETSVPYSYKQLHSLGYVIFHNVISKDNCSDLLEQAVTQSNKAKPIFNYGENNNIDDRKRKQVTFHPSKTNANIIVDIKDYIYEQLRLSVAKHTFSNFVVIHSKPGCSKQAFHCDYQPSKELDNACLNVDNMPLACLVALSDGTKLCVYNYGINMIKTDSNITAISQRITPMTLLLKAGDVVVFRGDLIHAGGEYDEDNYRLHAYIDSNRVPRTPNRTFVVKNYGTQKMRKILNL